MTDTSTLPSSAAMAGERLATIRSDHHLSQAQLALAASTTQQTISRIERGEQVPGDRLKVRIAKAVGMKAAELWPYADEEED